MEYFRTPVLLTGGVLLSVIAATWLAEDSVAADWGPVSSAGVTIISVTSLGEIKSMWRNSKFQDYTIIGMESEGGNDKFQVQLKLRQRRAITISLMADVGDAPTQNSEGFAFAIHRAEDDPNFGGLHRRGIRNEGVVDLTDDFFVCPGTYKIHGLWRGDLGAQIVGKGGSVAMKIKVHSPGTRLLQEHPTHSPKCTSFER
jgi:hypothetical protein